MNIVQLSKQFSANFEHLNTALEQMVTLVFIDMGDSHLPEEAHRPNHALANPKPSRPLTH
ncbi:MAG: hypothetical protein U5M23_11150 [Marinagarivorans sp.]|nr:hypothetical protein [Marinagarivorans sp.]